MRQEWATEVKKGFTDELMLKWVLKGELEFSGWSRNLYECISMSGKQGENLGLLNWWE